MHLNRALIGTSVSILLSCGENLRLMKDEREPGMLAYIMDGGTFVREWLQQLIDELLHLRAYLGLYAFLELKAPLHLRLEHFVLALVAIEWIVLVEHDEEHHTQ